MAEEFAAIESAVSAVQSLRKTLQKDKAKQVRAADELALMKACAHSWFKSLKPTLPPTSSPEIANEIDQAFDQVLQLSDRNPARRKVIKLTKELNKSLAKMRSKLVLVPSAVHLNPSMPQFSKLVANREMLAVLERRWNEVLACQAGGAYLAATVMLGGLLEAILLARVNQASDKGPMYRAKSAPKTKDGQPRPMKEWGLKDYLDVAQELGWITAPAKGVAEVLRDYRNYIHPEKELSHGVVVQATDTKMFLTVFVQIAAQVVEIA